jgi:hypothetical protein
MTTTDATTPPNGPQPVHRRSTPGAGHVVMVVLGALLVGFGLAVTGAVAPLEAALFQQRNGGFVTSPNERYQVDTYAITSQQLDVVLDGGIPAAGRGGAVATVMLRAVSGNPERSVFIGIGPQADVASYLADVDHSELARLSFNPFQATYQDRQGSQRPGLPSAQDFWAVSAQGPGAQEIQSDLRNGNWAVVIMNADASRPVAVDLQAGVRSRFLAPVTWGTLVAGLVLLAAGIPLVVAGAAGLGRSVAGAAVVVPGSAAPSPEPPIGPLAPFGRTSPAYPARLAGDLDPQLSRWKWLVKWFLAIPHWVVLSFLGVAFVVTTVIAGFAVLFTGRYPHSLFHFNVGVLRWGWRVTFYASAFGTDRYPPFTLARTDYPADFDVDYPVRLSRGLVLVKSWLLALPHLLIIGLITANLSLWWTSWQDGASFQNPSGISLVGLLTLVAGVTLLITRIYPQSLFDLIMGIYRWCYRVLTYVALMRDEYPPFRLDQGPGDPHRPEMAESVTEPQPTQTRMG